MAPLLLAVITSFQLHYVEPQPIPAHATAYCVTGTMASGEQTREGVCAGKAEWLGERILIFQRLPGGEIGEYLGAWDCMDTGGTPGLKAGKVVDIWKPDLDQCQEFMDLVYRDGCEGKVYIVIFSAPIVKKGD